jgi:phosphatidylserine decarboxylase
VRLAPEGLPFIGIATTIWIGLGIPALLRGQLWWLAFSLWTPIALWVAAFFRDPRRRGPRGDHLAIAPADGKVVSIVEIAEPEYLEGPARRVSVFMNVFNVHVNRAPANGVCEYRRYRAGKFVNATLDKASVDNEQMSIGIRTPQGPLLVRQIAGLIARRIVTDVKPGMHVIQGDRLGMIRFGSRVDTFLPMDAWIRVSVGDRVRAGKTVIAEWLQ